MERVVEKTYTVQPILWLKRWADNLLSFRLKRPDSYRFEPGQFARLGLHLDAHEAHIWRAYSMCSAATDEYLEFYSILVPDGHFSSRLARLKVGANVMLHKTAMGFFMADRLPTGKNLWLLATGTGLAPYLSILQDPCLWQRFDHIVLAHSVRRTEELSYQDFIASVGDHPMWAEHGHKLKYLPIVTGNKQQGMLNERIPALLSNGRLELAADMLMSPEDSRFMICGNPAMVADTHRQLMKMGYRMSRQGTPGHLVLENGW